jgi:hypothetical protein
MYLPLFVLARVHVPAGKWDDMTVHRVITGPADLTSYAAELSQTPTFIRLGRPDTGTLMHALTAA